MLHPDDLKLIRSIHLRLGRKVDSPFAGEYRSAFHGQGMEFEDVRPYVPGDDVRQLDWNVTARLGVPHIKQFREERELQLMLVADVSASMRFGRKDRDKRKSMATVVGALAFAALRSGDRVGMLTFSNGVERFCAPRKGRGHVWSLIRNIFADPAVGTESRLSDALTHLDIHLKRKSTICLISDFLFPSIDRIAILARKHTVHAFVIHDPFEEKIPISGLVDMRDAESGVHRLIDTRSWENNGDVEHRVQRLRKQGVSCSELSTDSDPVSVVLKHFRQFGT
jgi:uncharacterized protein (DUF58 family)